jgi:hypothetical protein
MYSTPIDFSFSYLGSAVEAALDINKDQVDPNSQEQKCLDSSFINVDRQVQSSLASRCR